MAFPSNRAYLLIKWNASKCLKISLRVAKNKRSQDCWSKWRRFGGHFFPYGISRIESKLFLSRDVHQRRGFGRAYSALPGPAASSDFRRTCTLRRAIGVFLSRPSPGVTRTWGSGHASLALVSRARSTPAWRLARRLRRAHPGLLPARGKGRGTQASPPSAEAARPRRAGPVPSRPPCRGSPSVRWHTGGSGPARRPGCGPHCSAQCDAAAAKQPGRMILSNCSDRDWLLQ